MSFGLSGTEVTSPRWGGLYADGSGGLGWVGCMQTAAGGRVLDKRLEQGSGVIMGFTAQLSREVKCREPIRQGAYGRVLGQYG